MHLEQQGAELPIHHVAAVLRKAGTAEQIQRIDLSGDEASEDGVPRSERPCVLERGLAALLTECTSLTALRLEGIDCGACAYQGWDWAAAVARALVRRVSDRGALAPAAKAGEAATGGRASAGEGGRAREAHDRSDMHGAQRGS